MVQLARCRPRLPFGCRGKLPVEDPPEADLPNLNARDGTFLPGGVSSPAKSQVDESGTKKEPEDPEDLVAAVSAIEATPTKSNDFEQCFSEIVSACKSMCLLEAASILEDFLGVPLPAPGQAWTAVPQDLKTRLEQEPLIERLRLVSARLRHALARTLAPNIRTDVNCMKVEIRDDAFGRGFCMEVRARFAEGPEHEANGATSQLFFSGHMTNLNFSLTQYASLLVEGDLFRPDYIKDCVVFNATMPEDALLKPIWCYLQLAPALLPFRIEEAFFRDCVICRRGPLVPGAGEHGPSKAGLLFHEGDPPDGATSFEGYPVPKTRFGTVRLREASRIIYVMPSTQANSTDVFFAWKCGVPLSSRLIPLGMIKNLVADITKNSLQRLNEQVIKNWAALDYDRRIAARPEIYEPVKRIMSFPEGYADDG